MIGNLANNCLETEEHVNIHNVEPGKKFKWNVLMSVAFPKNLLSYIPVSSIVTQTLIPH